ncbi:MAG: hypothetical protein M3Z25_19405 [Actinomycetota bacterium]|nr:hypothetical protein [Actinomycetota bacterium]
MTLDLSTLTVSVDAGVAELRMNRPKQANSLSPEMWAELRAAVNGSGGGSRRAATDVQDRRRGVVRELAYTCRPVSGSEAVKSPLALRGTKQAITYARDHSIADGLEQIATWNGATLLSADLDEALAAFREKRPGLYAD